MKKNSPGENIVGREPGDDSTKIPRRFDRMARLVGGPGLLRLMRSHVMVVGLGGVGGYAAEGLARSGIGKLTLIDFDEICTTNINRQIHALTSTVGKAKAVLMEERVKLINPKCEVRAPKVFYEKSTSEELLRDRPDAVIDCIDNLTAKLHLLSTCVARGIAVVTCLGASGKLDPCSVKTASLVETHTDPLAQAVRKNLRRKYRMSNGDMAKITAVFSDEPVILPDENYRSSLCGVECICPSGKNPHHTCQKRRIIYGTSVFVTSMFGMVSASLVLRRLLQDAAVGPSAR